MAKDFKLNISLKDIIFSKKDLEEIKKTVKKKLGEYQKLRKKLKR